MEQNRARQKRIRDKKKEESNIIQTLSNDTEENIKAGENDSGFQTIDF